MVPICVIYDGSIYAILTTSRHLFLSVFQGWELRRIKFKEDEA